jgi:hypothetical protein
VETLTEIKQQEQERRQRAMQFESLQNSQVALQNEIKNIKAQSFDCSAIEKILELAGQVPPGILTDGCSSLGLSIPGGIGARLALMQVASTCLAYGQRRESQRLEKLKTATAKLAKVEKDLEDFE